LFLCIGITFLENPALAKSPYAIYYSADARSFRLSLEVVHGAVPDITNGNISDLSILAGRFGFIRLFRQTDLP
jgi:hypothetical protein